MGSVTGTTDHESERRGHPAAAAIEISKRFGATQALRDVTLTVAAGESHALVGRNGAGKSTLVGVLTGLVIPEVGEVVFDDRPAPPAHARSDWQARVACVYQRPTVVPQLTVAENLFLNTHPRSRAGLIDWRGMRQAASDVLAEWGIEIDVEAPAFKLSVEERQLVEIGRALHQGSRFVILDEPTAQLDAQSTHRLFDHVRRLKASGVTFLYISHHLPEIFEICDSVTVLRNARRVLTSPLDGMTRDEIVEAMVGGGVPGRIAARRSAPADEARQPHLSVRNLRLTNGVGPVSFDVGRGERVGLASQRQSGGLDVGRAIVGLAGAVDGDILLDGERPRLRSPSDAAAAGVGYVPEDRHESGFAPLMSVADNATMPALPRLGRWGFVSPGRQNRLTRELIGRLAIQASERNALAELSGGNQQKVVMARALATGPSLLILLHPTAGIDVASKESLFKAIDDVSAAGTGTLIVSDELDELRQCDRVLVLFDGALVDEHGSDWEDEKLIAQMEGAL